MYVSNKTDDYEFLNNSTQNENEDVNIIIKYLLLSIPSSILLLCLISLSIYTMIKPLITNK